MNICQAGHLKHDRLMVDTVVGKMMVYDFEQYKDQPGIYCTGQDDISRTLKDKGVWGKAETDLIVELLEKGNKDNLVIDFGAHIGYYSILAAKLGYKVQAYEGNIENVEVLIANAKLNGVSDNIVTNTLWIDSKTAPIVVPQEVELIKIDLEGNEQYAVAMIDALLLTGNVKHIFMEVSPVFNNSYPDLVSYIQGLGYTVTIDGQSFDGNFDFSQENFLFTRND